MSAFVIRGAEKKLLRKASRQRVEECFLRLPSHVRSAEWLHKSNRYRLKCTDRYERDIKVAAPTVNHRHLIRYVSSSAPAHAIDGWSFLSRSVDATLRGDAYSAIHFAYYAELRAAMALLASEGMGIFNRCHPVIDGPNNTQPFPKQRRETTHKVTWPILRYWSSLQRAADLIDDLINPDSVSLSVWLRATQAAVPTQALAQRWLWSWGLDLAAVEDDRDNRNFASYRPSEFRKAPQLDVHEITQFVEQLWRLFEPGSDPRFPFIEKFLVRNAWRKSGASPAGVQGLAQLGLLLLKWKSGERSFKPIMTPNH